MAAPGARLEQRMELQPTAALVLLARLLALPASQLADAVTDAVDDNPALELLDLPRCPTCGRSLTAKGCRWCLPSARSAPPADRPDAPSARSELARDLASAVPAGLRQLAIRVVEELDEHGLLGRQPAELATELGEDAASVETVVATLQDLGPPGVGAADVTSSLLAQLEAWDGVPSPACTRQVLCHAHLLVEGGPGGGPQRVAHATGVDLDDVRDSLAFVARHLRPRPLDLGPPPITVTEPVDLLVTERPEGGLRVESAFASAYGLRVSAALHATATDPSVGPEVQGWAAERVRAARTFLHQLDERAGVLRRITAAAVAHQADFIRLGPSAHRPLTRASLATEVAVHESTVSRAVAGKRLRLPNGATMRLEALFGTNVAVKDALRRLLAEGGPRSDAALAVELARRGHCVARRTVAKYRAELTAAD